MKRSEVKAARVRLQHKLIARLGYDNYKIAEPYIDALINELRPPRARRVTLPGESEQQQHPDPFKVTPMDWQLEGKTVDVAVSELI